MFGCVVCVGMGLMLVLPAEPKQNDEALSGERGLMWFACLPLNDVPSFSHHDRNRHKAQLFQSLRSLSFLSLPLTSSG